MATMQRWQKTPVVCAAAVVAERIRQTLLETDLHWEGQKLDVRLSLGVAEAGVHADSFDDLIAAADHALYAAKDNGRDQTVIADPDSNRSHAVCPEVRAA